MQRLPAAQRGAAAKSKAMTPFMDFAASRVRATPCARSPTGALGGLFQTPLCHLGRLFQTRLYRLRPVGVPSRRIQDILSIAAAGILPSRRIQDILSITSCR